MCDDIKGWTIAYGTGIKYYGEHTHAMWFDDEENNNGVKIPEEDKKGFGFMFTLMFGYTIRPIAQWFNYKYYRDRKKIMIRDVPDDEMEDFFGEELGKRILELKHKTGKYSVYNPWFGKRWFVFRLPKWIPSIFFSISTPWKNLYLGSKTYEVDLPNVPGTKSSGKDISWVDDADFERGMKNKPHDVYYALCPSASFRSDRR